MSWEATTWAGDQSPGGPATKCLLLMLANHAQPDGVCYPGRASLAAECEMGQEAVTKHMAKLEEAGLIARRRRLRKNGSRTSDWVVLAPLAADRGSMKEAALDVRPPEIVALARLGGESQGGDSQGGDYGGSRTCKETASLSENSNSVVAPIENSNASELGVEQQLSKVSEAQGTLMPSENGGDHENGNGHRPVKFDRQVVPPEVLRRAEAALAVFNECAGRRLRPYTARGEKSDALGRILGKLLDHPEVPDAQLHQAIRNVFANPPGWLKGAPPDVGDIFGRNSFRRALANDGVRREQLTASEQASARKKERLRRRVAAANVVEGTAVEVGR